MMRLFKVPDTAYTDFYDIARFKLAYKINVILTVSLLIIAIYFSFFSPTVFLQYFIGFVIGLTGLIILIRTKKFIAVSYFISFSSLILVGSSVFLVKNMPHLIEPLWLVVIMIFTYFNLGKLIGHILLSLVILCMTYYFMFFMQNNFVHPLSFSQYQLVGIALEFALCLIIIGYFIHHFIKSTAYAEFKYREANKELLNQNLRIAEQHEEKTVLLQEIHHRVKNNLQVITSLLRLQSSEIDSDEARAHFSDAINRIMTMSLIHQKMYQEKNLSKIDTADYFKTLIYDLIRTSSVNIPVQIEVTANLHKFGSKTIVPLALLIAELVSNSLKHAFDKEGKVIVFFSEETDKNFRLEYFDNGIWKNESNESSFGLQLIQTLTEQMEGEYSRITDANGTLYQFKLTNLDV